MKKENKERRKAPRSDVNLPATVKGSRGFFSHAHCMGLSPHGAELVLDWPVEPGRVYELSISITPQVELRGVKASCVRCTPFGPLHRAAVSFVNLAGPTFRALQVLYRARAFAE